jgi:DNA-binding NarL/FixJ family response regulator
LSTTPPSTDHTPTLLDPSGDRLTGHAGGQPARKSPFVRVIVAEANGEDRLRWLAILADVPGLVVESSHASAYAALRAAQEHWPDLLLVGRVYGEMGSSGLVRAWSRSSPANSPGGRSVYLGWPKSEQSLCEALEAGASAFLAQDMPPKAIASVVAMVLVDQAVLPQVALRTLAERVRRAAPVRLVSKSAQRPAPARALSAREREVLELVARGFSFAEISEMLALSSHTVQTHVKRLYAKLSVHSKNEAVFEAQKLGWIVV